MNDVIAALNQQQETYTIRSGELNALQTSRVEYEEKLVKLKANLQDLDVTRILLQQTSDSARDKARKLLEDTTTIALQYVFGSNFSAKIDMRVLNGKPSADIYVVTDMGNGEIITAKPEDSCGGGVVDIVSIALRISLIQLKGINGPIILDEPGKHVSSDYSVKLAEFLKYISTTFNKQIIFVTHNEDLKSTADKAYVASIQNGSTVVKESNKAGTTNEEEFAL